METILLVATVFALFGAYLNSKRDNRGFMIWVVTNIIFFANNWYIGQWQQAILFGLYLVMSLNGVYNSRKQVKSASV